jgi:hypothetical protein
MAGDAGNAKLGKRIATVGIAIFAVSIFLAIAGTEVATINNILQIGGIGLAVIGLVLWRILPGETAVFEGPVTLRETQDADGIRRLTALLVEGDLEIQGWDYGPGVERIFGYREYEWVRTIKASDVPRLREALGNPPDLTEALRRKFNGKTADELQTFLDSKGIPYDSWTRIGD